MQRIITEIIGARYDYERIIRFIEKTIDALKGDPTISSLWEAGLSALSAVIPYLAVVFLALALVETFFGAKLMTLQKLIASFVGGFVVGVHWISPIVDTVFVVAPWIVGLVIGAVALILFNFCYFVFIIGVAGYPVYYLCYNAAAIPQLTGFTKENMIFSAIAAAVAVIIVCLLLKYVEIVGTSLLGGYFSALCIKTMYDFTTLEFLQGYETISFYVVIGVIALLGFVFQFKTRRRY